MSKKILIISNFHEDSPISRSNMAFNYYIDRGYDPIVLCSSFSHSLKKFREFDNKNFITLKTISYTSSLSINRILSYLVFSYGVFKFLGKNRFDLVYVNLPPNGLGLPLLLRKKRFTNLVVDIIDLWPESFPINKGVIKKTILYTSSLLPKIIRKKIIDYSDFCITESNYFYEKLDLKNNSTSKVIYIKKPKLIEPCFEKVSKELSIIYLGNIGKIYDFDSLIKIIKGVKKKRKVVLHIIGLGPLSSWFFDSLKNENIDYHYHGASFDENFKSEIISKCWFGFNGYKNNTEVALSYKSIDYLSYGVPLINSAKEDTRDLVDNERIGYNFHSESLKIIIDELSKVSLGEIDLMKKRSYNLFKNSFSEKSYYSEMDSVMNKVNNL
jgi:glycosyltransferase involved in cell wall biosynthesis